MTSRALLSSSSRASSFASFASFALVLASANALGGCGGSIAADPDGPDPGDSGLDVHEDTGLRPRDSGLETFVDSGHDTALVRDSFFDPGCGDTSPPPPHFSCDPYELPSKTCPAGQGCFPFVEPSTGPCDPETYAADCFPVGTGKQGTPCDGSPCAAGFICVVSGAGNQCGAICHVGAAGACTEGLVCSPVDVPGIGVCL